MEHQKYMLVGGIPIIDGPGFLTPVFASRSSNSLWYQDIEGLDTIVGFLEVPEQAGRRVKNIGAICEKTVGEAPVFCFSDEAANFHVDTLEGLRSELVNAFWRLGDKKHLRRTIARALKVPQLLQESDREFSFPKHSSNRKRKEWPVVAETHSETELNTFDLGLHEDVFARLQDKANTLLVGPRGSGKTFMLRKLKQKLEAQGNQVVYVRGGASDQPLLVTLALACSLHVDGGGSYRAKLKKLMVTTEDVSQEAINDMFGILDAAIDSGGVDTVIIDDVYAFHAGSPRRFPVPDDEILLRLMRGYSSRIIASTSHVLGYQNVVHHDARELVEGQDYRSIVFGFSAKPEVDRNVIEQLLQRDKSLSGLTEDEKNSVAEYLSGINIRRKLTFLRELALSLNEYDTVDSALKSIHEKTMHSYLSLLGNYAGGHMAEVERQAVSIVEEVKKSYRRGKKAYASAGRAGSPSGPLSFYINLADDITLIAAMVQTGLIHLETLNSQLQSNEARGVFANRHDEDWFVAHFANANDPKGNSDGQYDLF